MQHTPRFGILAVCIPILIVAACGAAAVSTSVEDNSVGVIADDVPEPYRQFYNGTSVSIEGDYYAIRSKGVPDHKSPYFATSDARYAAYSGNNPQFMLAPGRIQTQSYVFRIPRNPTRAAHATATNLGPIGVALNGVAFFNQYNGQNRPLTVEINTFDQYYGHPTPTNEYHYHAEPTWLTQTKGATALLGFLLDGFPVYGPMENGKRITNADLDELHGHAHATAEFPNGIYHYHITDADPYLNGAGYYGTPGTLSR